MKRSHALLLAGAAALAFPLRAGAQVIDGPYGLLEVGTDGESVSGKTVCASNGGATSGCVVAVTSNGSSTGNIVGVTGTGSSSGGIVGVTGTGSSTNNMVGVAGTGPSNTNGFSVSVLSPADAACVGFCASGPGGSVGGASVSVTGPAGTNGCPNSMVAVSVTGAACATTLAVSGTSSATGAVAVEGMCLPVVCGYGSATLEFSVSGTLNPFPGTLQTTTFSGTGTGAGTATGLGSDGRDYHADFTITSMSVSGAATYNEPIWPVCPVSGSAVPMNGQVTVTAQPGAVGGVVYAANGNAVGSVTSLTTTLSFQYNREGAAATLVVTNGTAYIGYSAGGRTGTMRTTYAGAGVGAFQADAVKAEDDCRAGTGSLPYTLTGDVTVVG